jgi:hypothetical protein
VFCTGQENANNDGRYLEAIGDLSNEGALYEKRKSIADGVWQREHEDAVGGWVRSQGRLVLPAVPDAAPDDAPDERLSAMPHQAR